MLHSPRWADGNPPTGGNRQERDGDPPGTAQGRAVLAQAGLGELAERPDAPSDRSRGSPIEVGVSATVRLHALVGKKDGQTITPNEEMKLDCQDLSELVLTRCRLF